MKVFDAIFKQTYLEMVIFCFLLNNNPKAGVQMFPVCLFYWEVIEQYLHKTK